MPFELCCCPQVTVRMPEQQSWCVGAVALPWLLSFKQSLFTLLLKMQSQCAVYCFWIFYFIFLWWSCLLLFNFISFIIFSKQTCMVVHNYINIPYRVEINVFSWVAQKFFCLVPSSSCVCLVSNCDILTISYCSSAFSVCV